MVIVIRDMSISMSHSAWLQICHAWLSTTVTLTHIFVSNITIIMSKKHNLVLVHIFVISSL